MVDLEVVMGPMLVTVVVVVVVVDMVAAAEDMERALDMVTNFLFQ